MSPSRSAQGSFKYQSLNTSTPSFRLLRICNVTEGPIECILTNHAFQDGRVLPYKAVSYVWGSSEKPQSIFINESRLHVTQSLFDMLHSLRSTGSETTYLWIDAICINQENLHERNHQVQQMKTIYASATEVIFYLGQATPDTDFLLGILRRLDAESSKHLLAADEGDEEYVMHISNVWAGIEASLHCSYSGIWQRLQMAMADLLKRPWFRRAWVIQEVCNAKTGIVRCGDFEVPSWAFAFAVNDLEKRASAHSRNIVGSMPGVLRRANGETRCSLFQLLLQFRNAEATLARDRIYGLLGLYSTPADKEPLLVDYHRTDDDVIRDTIAHLCDCKLDQLPQSMYPDIEAFLADLETVPGKTFSMLLFTGDFVTMARLCSRQDFYDQLTAPYTWGPWVDGAVQEQFTIRARQPGRVLLVRLSSHCLSTAPPDQRSGSHGSSVIDIKLLFPEQGNDTSRKNWDIYGCIAGHDSKHAARVLERLNPRPGRRLKAKACDYIHWNYYQNRWVDVILPDQRLSPPGSLMDAVERAKPLNSFPHVLPPPCHDPDSVRDRCVHAARDYDRSAWAPFRAASKYRGSDWCHHQALAVSMKQQIELATATALVEFRHDALYMADIMCEYCSPDTWDFLVEENPAGGHPVLWWAIKEGNVELIRALICRNVQLDVEHPSFGTPMDFARKNGHEAVVDFLSAGQIDEIIRFNTV